MPFNWLAVGVVVSVVGLVVTIATTYKLHWSRVAWKTLTSTGFMVIAFSAGVFDHGYDAAVLAGLLLCFVGDVLLVYKGKIAFLAGLVSFLLAHALFVYAFWLQGVAVPWCLASFVVLIPFGLVVWRWLHPSLPPEMRIPVIAYMLIISAMAAASIGVIGNGGSAVVVVAAILFYISDLFVARDHFVAPGFPNTILGLPLYYSAVCLFAFSIGLN
ncbi:MAG: lysoplasmalogenase [bacterium]|nr:lysoplasmalogenase [bacterium]